MGHWLTLLLGFLEGIVIWNQFGQQMRLLLSYFDHQENEFLELGIMIMYHSDQFLKTLRGLVNL